MEDLAMKVLSVIAVFTNLSLGKSLLQTKRFPVKFQGNDNISTRSCGGVGQFRYRSMHAPSSPLFYSRIDDLFSGIAKIGVGFSVGVIWSEYNVVFTGCGPMNFSDTLERVCYQGVIVMSGISIFNRIVRGVGLTQTVDDVFGPLELSTTLEIRLAEFGVLIAVAGAFFALYAQYIRGASMDGMSGIDIAMCRAIRDL